MYATHIQCHSDPLPYYTMELLSKFNGAAHVHVVFHITLRTEQLVNNIIYTSDVVT